MGLNTYPYNPFPASTDKLDEAHNEQIQEEVDQLKSGLTTLDNEVNGDATVYPYADVITIPDAIPANLADCTVKIEPVQSGSGDPSPENVRPITGHTEASVQRDGRNQFNINDNYINRQGAGGTYNISGNSITVTSSTQTSAFAGFIKPLEVGERYTISYTSTSKIRILQIDEPISVIVQGYYGTDTDSGTSFVASKPYILINCVGDTSGVTYSNIQLEKGQTATPYEPYAGKTYTIALGDTVYGGTVDFNSGVMTVTHKYVDLSTLSFALASGNRWATQPIADAKIVPDAQVANAYCSTLSIQSKDAITNNESLIGIAVNSQAMFVARNGSDTDTPTGDFVYELATPTTIQLTPQQIQLLKGTNTLTASTGDISVTVNGVSGSIGAVQTQANATDEALAELAEKLPTAPTTDGAYVLTVTVADGTPTYSWESAT